MLEIDEKAMAYCLVEALFAAGVINLPTYYTALADWMQAAMFRGTLPR